MSEVFFFLAFFWAFFHVSLSPSIVLGNLASFSFEEKVFLLFKFLYLILLSFNIWSNSNRCSFAILAEDRTLAIQAFLLLFFGLLFLQLYKLLNIFPLLLIFLICLWFGLLFMYGFSWLACNWYYFSTVCLYRFKNFHFTPDSHFGFEAAARYWHFVDVVAFSLYLFNFWGNQI